MALTPDVKADAIYEHIMKLHEMPDVIWSVLASDVGDLRKRLKNGEDISEKNFISRNVLHTACRTGNHDIVELVLTSSAYDVNLPDGMGYTPLYYSCFTGTSVRVTNLLFSYGAVIHPRKGPTDLGFFLEFVLMAYPTKEEVKLIKILLEHGAVIHDPQAPGGHQVLHYAAMGNNCKMIKILVNLGANLHAQNCRGMTPLDVAIKFNCKDARTLLESIISKEQNIRALNV